MLSKVTLVTGTGRRKDKREHVSEGGRKGEINQVNRRQILGVKKATKHRASRFCLVTRFFSRPINCSTAATESIHLP